MNKRYQVFISSTYDDLVDERRAVEEVIMRGGDIPVGMEAFPAADEEQFEFIKSIITESDYYVLIIAGRYGTISTDGLSFTEKEFDFAVSCGIPILFLLRDDIKSLPADKSEDTPAGRKKRTALIKKASEGRLRKSWSNIDALKLVVREALDHSKATKSRPGWVRGDKIASEDALQELAVARRENDSLRLRVGSSGNEILLPPLPTIDEKTVVLLLGNHNAEFRLIKVRASWLDFFPVFHRSLSVGCNDWNGEEYWHVNDHESLANFGAIVAEMIGVYDQGNYLLSQESLSLLLSFYQEIGLVNTENTGETFTRFAHQLSRRQRISGGVDTKTFEVVERLETKVRRDLDDEIPF